MVEWILSSSVLIAVVILLRLLLKGRISLRLQYALWMLVLVRLLVPVSFGQFQWSAAGAAELLAPVEQTIDSSELALPINEYYEFESMDAYDAFAESNKSSNIFGYKNPEFKQIGSSVHGVWAIIPMTVPWRTVLYAAWIFGTAITGIWFLFSNLRLKRSLRKTRILLTDSQALPVYLSNAIDTPCLFGLFRPTIYLTGEAIENEQTQRHAVEHELTHFRHRDNIWAILRGVCLAIHWFNPLVWCAAALSRNDAELACDESTILRLGEEERSAYGRTLIRLTCEKRPTLLNIATTMTGRGKSIKERISLIAKKPRMTLCTVIAVTLVAAVAVSCTFTGAEERPASFEEWTGSLSGDAIEWAEAAKGYGVEEIFYAVPENEFDHLSALLHTITDESCFRRDPKADDEEGYRLALYRDDKLWLFKCLADGTVGLMFNDPETGAYYGSEGKLLIIESPDLWNYIVRTVDEKGISHNSYSYNGLEISIPNEYTNELIVYSGEDAEDENTLISVYGKAAVEAFEAAGLGENDGIGWIFSIVRYSQAEYQEYLNNDHSGQYVFAKDDTWYYCRCMATDVRFYPTGNISDLQRWEELNSALVSEVITDFIARNHLQLVDEQAPANPANAKPAPAAAVYELFHAAGDMTVTLYLSSEGACNPYTVTDPWYAERFEVLLMGYKWTETEMPNTMPSEYWLTLHSSTATKKLTVWAGGAGIIQYDDGSTTTFWKASPLYDTQTSIAYDIRREYDNLDVDYSRIRFYLKGDAQQAAQAFVQTAYGSHRLSLMPGNWYGIREYEVIDWAVKDISADETAVAGWFEYAFIPEDANSTAVWAGNTVSGTGEYEGMLTAYREFVLQKQDDGYWHCIGLGTGGYTLPE